MKKLYFVAIAAIFALAMVSCDFSAPEEATPAGNVWYTEDGRAMVDIDLGVNRNTSRALTETLARAGADYFEVVFAFYNTTTTTLEYYRTSFRDGRTARMSVPLGDYDNTTGGANANHAYMFAGRYESRTLLGVGTLDSITYLASGTPGNGTTEINKFTETVTFRVYALETDVNDGKGINPSTFTTDSLNPVASITVENGAKIPVFMLDKKANGGAGLGDKPLYNAEFGIKINTAATALLAQIKVADPTNATFTSAGFLWDEGDYPLAAVTATFTNNLVANAALDLPLAMTIATPDKSGLCKLALQVPVYMMNNSVASPNGAVAQTWYIRGGINNSLVDAGVTFNEGDGSQGGALLFGVGDVLDGNGFIIGKTW